MMRTCTIIYWNLLSSQVITIVSALTTAGGRWWLIAPNLDDGYLYYYYLVLPVICLKNSVAYVLLCCKHGKYGCPPFFPLCTS
ncbi:hypothetical protein GQ55_1G352100 [Panicum hallii var. hallii]|uniref:Uncharacterized protein n=1 Tax=Panicum hallii var. hallii TaxID=1504633 RepID=A0A2T7FAW1_9POAL|nr:hypothetical protein GQ55_1G352100 [Panicum hallii var. hallii]